MNRENLNPLDIPNTAFSESNVLDSLKVGQAKAISSAPLPIGEQEIKDAFSRLEKFKAAKVSLDSRIKAEEEWWKLLQWQMKKKDKTEYQPASAWTFNAITAKHADMMDSIPKVTCLPREKSDEKNASILTDIFPSILDVTNWEEVYSNHAWYLIKHGVSIYGVFWDKHLSDGLGDIRIKNVNALNFFCEPDVEDIQLSSDIFIVSLCNVEKLNALYPKHEGKFKACASGFNVNYYQSENVSDLSDKALVIDWYYKKVNEFGKDVLHYVKFCGDIILYASENDPKYAQIGWYSHGKYPFEVDVLYPIGGTWYGYGIIKAAAAPQLAIDSLDYSIMRYAKMKSKPRYFYNKGLGMDISEFADWEEDFVAVEGMMEDNMLKQININSLDSFILNVRESKITELKETIANRDVNSGGTVGGVTSGAAIATLQEAGNKNARDIINGSYRVVQKVAYQVIELIRQFYTEPRVFRIIGEGTAYSYMEFGSENIEGVQTADGGDVLYSKPIFDIRIIAQKKSPFSSLSQNETMVNLYNMGMLNPENSQMALIAIELMEFEGKDKVVEYIKNGQTLKNIIEQQNQVIAQQQQQIMALSNTSSGMVSGLSEDQSGVLQRA